MYLHIQIKIKSIFTHFFTKCKQKIVLLKTWKINEKNASIQVKPIIHPIENIRKLFIKTVFEKDNNTYDFQQKKVQNKVHAGRVIG